MRVNSHSVRETKCLEEKEERNTAKKGIRISTEGFIYKNILLKRIFQKARFKRWYVDQILLVWNILSNTQNLYEMPQIKNVFHVQGWKEGGEDNRAMSKRKK